MKRAIVILQRRGSQWNPDLPVRQQALWDEHASFIDALFEAGTVIMAGPFDDASGAMLVLNVAGTDAARAIMRDDPWAQQDILVAGEVKEWTIFLDARDKPQSETTQ